MADKMDRGLDDIIAETVSVHIALPMTSGAVFAYA